MVNTQMEITLLAEPLGLGETVRSHCPVCQGSKPTLTVTRKEDGSVVWNCYRLACDFRGASHSHGYYPSSAPKAEAREIPKEYTGELRRLSEAEEQILCDRTGITPVQAARARIRYAVAERRYAFPVLSPAGRRRGLVLRSYSGGFPKALTVKETTEPMLAWAAVSDAVPRDGPTFVVEDLPSAVRASEYVHAVALLGTSCSQEYALEIAAFGGDVVWALDADATAKAIKLYREHMNLFERSRVVTLERDLKDMDEAALADLLRRYV